MAPGSTGNVFRTMFSKILDLQRNEIHLEMVSMMKVTPYPWITETIRYFVRPYGIWKCINYWLLITDYTVCVLHCECNCAQIAFVAASHLHSDAIQKMSKSKNQSSSMFTLVNVDMFRLLQNISLAWKSKKHFDVGSRQKKVTHDPSPCLL